MAMKRAVTEVLVEIAIEVILSRRVSDGASGA
jgi:hypothetical protein